MIDNGVLAPDDHVELIGEVIVEKSPAGIPHNHLLMQIVRLFAPLLSRFEIAIQGTLTVVEGHVFDPDFMLLRQRPHGYKTKLPDASDVQLVIEAAESSLHKDQQIKAPVYAAVGIPEYWVADLDREQLLVHRNPEGGAYKTLEIGQGDDLVSPIAAPEISFPVRRAFD
ncbi:MAG TPA: Uma2 family endonuclease [Lacipirellulaceae bacterium]|nr:Uma2 family endonuclease [Lacipirellulaceae bacterium]